MDRDQADLQILTIGVDRLRQGIRFSFNDVEFRARVDERQLDVSAFTSWSNTTSETAASDLNRAQTTFLYLKSEFPAFAKIVEGLEPRFSVIQDMGNMIEELAYLTESGVVALEGEEIPLKSDPSA